MIYEYPRRSGGNINLKQLRALCEIVDHGLRITDAAEATFRSQPSVTRQIQELEDELGFGIFVRKRNKVLAITPQGERVLQYARGILRDADNIYRMRDELTETKKGTFTIATTHTYARYVLPPIIHRFTGRYPAVQLRLRQGNSTQSCELVAQGKADIAICSDPTQRVDDVVRIPCYKLQRCVITPARHELLRAKPLTLELLARYPLITLDEAYHGRQTVDRAFSKLGLKPSIVLSTSDTDVSKAYVALGLGIAIFAKIVFNAESDKALRVIDASHLFPPGTTNIVLHRHSYLRSYGHAFLQMFAPRLTKAEIEYSMHAKRPLAVPHDELPEL